MARQNAPRRHDGAQRISLLRDRLMTEAQQVRTAQDWTQCLRVAASMPHESWANIILITAANPGATLVKGYEGWQSAGSQVSRSERGIEIFSQASARRGRGHGSARPGWREAVRTAYVWDISQTAGQADPGTIGEPPAATAQTLYEALSWLARREGYAVEREFGCPADGATRWSSRRIRILPGQGAEHISHGITAEQAAWALAHQLGHIFMHGTSNPAPGATTTGENCAGIRKAEADAVAWITCTRSGIEITHELHHPQTWAGTDPRAQPGAAILAAGERIVETAGRIAQHLDHTLATTRKTGAGARADRGRQETGRSEPRHPQHGPERKADTARPREAGIYRVLADAQDFFTGQLAGSWVPEYLRSRGIEHDTAQEWGIGHAPPGWTTLTAHLRSLGHRDPSIQQAGLARESSGGRLIDHFRDMATLPVHDNDGRLAGFIGRANPAAVATQPKYLNTPETPAYHKGDMLFGFQQARGILGSGAVPALVEGPFDAIAVSLAGASRYAGLAPCGTALTARQVSALARVARLDQTGIIVAFDDDAAGHRAALRAHDVLRPFSSKILTINLTGKDPAQIFQSEGRRGLLAVLSQPPSPLSVRVVDAAIGKWERRLHDVDGPLLAMRSAAAVVAGLVPPPVSATIQRLTHGRELSAISQDLRQVTPPELPAIASALPAEIAFLVTHIGERTGIDSSIEILTEVVNAVTREPKHAASLSGRDFPSAPPTADTRADAQALSPGVNRRRQRTAQNTSPRR